MRTSRAKFGAIAAAVALAAASLVALAAPAGASVTFDGTPGTAAPPSTLGPYDMSSFASSSVANGTSVSSVNELDTFGGATVTFDHALVKQTVGSGWSTWSHGYTGDVYTNLGSDGSQDALTIGLPEGTSAFYFYAEPNNFGTFDVTATAQDGTTSDAVAVTGASGATYFGFYGDPGNPLVSVDIAADPAANGFAVGEFGIAQEGFSSDVTLTKVVQGDAAAAGPTTVTVTCTYGDPIEVDFPATGGSVDVTIQSSVTLMNTCSFEETDKGGALSTSYACAGDNPDNQLPAAAALDDPVCVTAGPQATPISVNIADSDQTAEVTITNTYAVQIAPRFTG